MKFSKNITKFLVLSLFFIIASCQTRVVSPAKPLQDNSLSLYKKYTIQTKDAKTQKIEILKVDATKIYGINKDGKKVEIAKSDVREIKKPNFLYSIFIGIAIIGAIIAVIFIPV